MLKLHSRQSRWGWTIAGLLTLGLTLAPVASFAVLVPGGGPKKSDCFIELNAVGASTVTNNKIVNCNDGDTCDSDGAEDGTCTFLVSLCPNQTNVPGCTPQPLTGVTVSGASLTTPDLSGSACGPTTAVPVKLKIKKNGTKKPGKLKIRIKATSSGKPKTDSDTVMLICKPPSGQMHVCPAPASCANPCGKNAAGGPDEIDLLTADSGTDLDNGWTGISHNFPTPPRSFLKMCLSTCDASTNPLCDACAPVGAGTINGPTFGPPLPLIAQSVPVCVINRYSGSPWAKFNVQNGEVSPGCPVSVNLLSDVHLTQPTAVCPRCKGAGAPAFGGAGTCDGGPSMGHACTIDSILSVVQAEGSPLYALSRDCPPDPGQLAGTLNIALQLTTGTTTLKGPKPCTPQNTGGVAGVGVQDDNCHGSVCNAGCTGAACVSHTPDGQCVDSKGGISQLCCATSTVTPCFPTSTASGGAITRTGHPDPPVPVWPDPTYPKTSSGGVLVTTFCEGATTASTINSTAGLPGPGALILPGTQTLIKLP